MDLEESLDALYRGPTQQFVAGRNALVRGLRKAGDAVRADEVSRLSRPSPVAWMVNQLHFTAPELLRSLFEAAAALRRTQEQAEAPLDLAKRQRAHTDALAAATRRAIELGEHVNINVTSVLRRRLELTLSQLSATGAAVEPRPGRMSTELEPAGFDALTAAAAPESFDPAKAARHSERKAQATASATAARNSAALEDAETKLEAIEREMRRLEREAQVSATLAKRAERDVEDAERRAEAARQARQQAIQTANDANDKVASVRDEVSELRELVAKLRST